MLFGLRYLCGILLVMALGLASAAVPDPELSAPCRLPAKVAITQDPQSLRSGVEVLFDPGHDYRLEQLTGTAFCQRFQPVAGTPNFGFERRGIWLRFRLAPLAGSPASWRLLVPVVGTDRFCVHWPVRPAGYESACGDLRAPAGGQPRTDQGWYFALPEALDPARPVFLYTQGVGLIRVPLQFGTSDALVSEQRLRQTWAGAYYGLIFGTVLFGLVLFGLQKDRTYLYFAISIGSGALAMALLESDLSALGLGGWLANRLVLPLACAAFASATPFFQHFLETRTHTPRLHQLLWPVTVAIVPPMLVVQWWPRIASVLLAFIHPLWSTLLLTAMVLRIRQGSRPAVFALLAFGSTTLAFAHRIIEAAGLQLIDVATAKMLFYAGWFLNPGLLLVGLVERMRRLASERESASRLALFHQQLALHRAQYDELTRLPNRAKFREDLHELLTDEARHHRRFALVTVGLDRFSAINSTLGHKIGDSVLDETAARLTRGLPEHLLLARTGPDLFAWVTQIVPGPAGVATLIQDCERLQHSLAAPLELGQGATLTASFGLALYPDHADSAEQLLQCSDTALHSAKVRGRGLLQLFEPAMHQTASRHLELNKDLHRALEQKELELHYQPIVALATGELLGVEALARWPRKDGRHVPPDQFVPVAEAGGLLRPFTEWTIRTACRQMADWRRRRVPVPYLSFNLSAAQMRLSQIDEEILRRMDEAGLAGSALAVEVTEGGLLESLDAARAMLTRLRERGVSVAVDDFGIGYASPHYLRVLPVNILKIDGSFLKDVPDNPEATSLLNGIIDMGRSLRLRMVVEVVETKAQTVYLASRGVTAGQGFWFSCSLPAAALETWMRDRPAPVAA